MPVAGGHPTGSMSHRRHSMDTEFTAEPIEDFDALEQADAVRLYMEWDIARLRACIVELEVKLEKCSECITKRTIRQTI